MGEVKFLKTIMYLSWFDLAESIKGVTEPINPLEHP